MNAPHALHPADQTLSAYGLGKLDDAAAEWVNQHLESCPACRRRVAELSADSFLGRLRDAQAQPESGALLISSTAGLSMLASNASPQAPPRPARCPRAWPTTRIMKSSASWDRAVWVWSSWRRTRSWGARRYSRSSVATS
jgi:anti-sigma factor RsiW